MKKQFLYITTLILWLIISWVTFAKDIEYTDCTQQNNWWYYCQDYQSCNNPEWTCVCIPNSLIIPHNTTCFSNRNNIIKTRVSSSYSISWSVVSFRFIIQNTAGDKYFYLDLPESYNNPKIRITDLDTTNLENYAAVLVSDGLVDPKYLIESNETRSITITWEVISSTFLFDQITVTPYITSLTSSTRLDQIATFILPIANYSINQNLENPKPIFSGDTTTYTIIVKNNWSVISNNNLTVSSSLDSVLGSPSFDFQKAAILPLNQNDNTYSRNIGSLSMGQTKIYTLRTPFLSTPAAGKTITTTSSLSNNWRELDLSDNRVTTSYTIPTFIDILLWDIGKISEEPETSGNIVWFSLTYTNNGNTSAENISLTTEISNTDHILNTISLPDLAAGESNNIIITWLVNQNYPLGTKFCLSGSISAGNETEDITNNSFSNICYTYVESADLVIEANLTNWINTIISWAELIYEVKIANKGEKTARGINLKFYPSKNQIASITEKIHDFENALQHSSAPKKSINEIQHNLEDDFDNNATKKALPYTWSFDNIILVWGEEKTLYYRTTLKEYPISGTSISLSGEILFTGIELDITNNTFFIDYNLPGLSDVYISHTMLPFSGFKVWDTVTYIITYGNSGYTSAWNPMVNIDLPSVLTTDQTEWSLWKSLGAGNSWTLIVTGKLNQFLAAGTEFTSTAYISTDSAQVTTDNDTSIISGTIDAYNDITFDLIANNTTHPSLTSDPQVLVRAVSGDIITFTVNYANNGNVPTENVNITFSNLGWVLVLDSYQNIQTIWINQQWSFTVNGRITSANFANFNPTVIVTYSGWNISDSVTIEEPYMCGDGFLTRDEVCEVNGQIWVGTWQECQNQQGVCVLVTKRISNTACVEFNGNTVCSNPAVITLNDPRCGYLDITNENDNSTEITARCFGEYTNAYTPVSISCGNGETYSGFAWSIGMFAANCSYSSTNVANNARISCSVGNDINNPDCRRWVVSCDIDLETDIVILDSDESEWRVEVSCSTSNGQEANLQIDCGNGRTSDIDQDNEITYDCIYDEEDFDENEYTIQCLINGSVSCDDDVILDQWFVGICGNGIREWYEQCDCGWGTDERWAGYCNGQVCKRWCTLDEPAGACLSIGNANISVQNNEIMPFWWRIYDTNNITNSSSCNEYNEQNILESSMKCTFSIKQPDRNSRELFTVDCNEKQLTNITLFSNYFSEYWSRAFWNYFINLDTLSQSNIFNDTILGEHKIRLEKVEYEYCACDEDDEDDCDWEETELQNVCETNFTVTKPYLVQKSAFGVTPKATTIDLEDFYDINGDPLIDRTDLRDVMILDENDYAGETSVVDYLMDSFIAKMERLSVSIATNSLPSTLRNAWVSVKKVPSQDIYILQGNWTPIALKPSASFSKPFTIIVKDTTLIIEGNVDVNGMFIVKWGTIKFNETSDSTCTQPQIVKGIFVANNFDANKITNDNINHSRCNAGWLYVKGVLIGNGIENLVRKKRSSLPLWFRVSWSERSIKVQRRTQIFNGASVVIEYSPELWQQLPPGADEFTQALEMYKK